MTKFLPLLFFLIVLDSCSGKNMQRRDLRIWFDHPADASVPDVEDGWLNDAEWLKALPVGNGFIGAMVFGDVNIERIQLNNKNLWSGSPDDNDNPEASEHLYRIRRLLFEGRYREATELTLRTQVCRGAGSGNGNGAGVPFGCYQTLGDLWLDFNRDQGYEEYHRELNLDYGVVSVSYTQDGIKYKREVFASYPDRALVIHISSDTRGSVTFDSWLTRPERSRTSSSDGHILMSGTLSDGKGGEGMSHAVRVKAVAAGGTVSCSDGRISVNKADEALLVLVSSTDYRQEYPGYLDGDPVTISLEQLNEASSRPFGELLKRHIADYRSLFGRVSLDLAGREKDTVPTDRRLLNQLEDPDDMILHETYFQFGRYLLISSSREGSLPANLQGIWANKIQTPWNCDYHTNINVQMNYWPADVGNLSDCHSPLSDLILSLVKPGERTAAVQYGADGWCVHPITNVWGFTAPGEHPGWGLHVVAGAWLCQHLWDHFTFTLDTAYLRKVYPVMLGSARFYLDWLVEDPVSGELVSGPAGSPENSFIAPDGSTAQISMGPSHDQEVIYDLFSNVLNASAVLNDSDPLLAVIKAARSRLAMPHIGSDGRLMEWREEFREAEPFHRHVSHLYMLHPGNLIDPVSTPQLADAARKSLEARTDIGTGWSLAWKINFWARLHDGNRAYKLLKNLLRPITTYSVNMSDAGGTYQNLFCGHPPFQIDGNFGATAGIAEMLLQSHTKEGERYVIQVLPALPDAWKDGEVRGLKARGGFEADIKWKTGKLVSCTVRSNGGAGLKICYGRRSVVIDAKPGMTYHFNRNLE